MRPGIRVITSITPSTESLLAVHSKQVVRVLDAVRSISIFEDIFKNNFHRKQFRVSRLATTVRDVIRRISI